jgi:hypothetical protein
MNNYIDAVCHTYLDDYTCNVTKFAALPRIGDKVACVHKQMTTTLKIIDIIHDQVINILHNQTCEIADKHPFIRIELGL